MNRPPSHLLRRWLPIFVGAAFVLLLGTAALWRNWEAMRGVESLARDGLSYRLAADQYVFETFLRLQNSDLVAEAIAQFGSLPETTELSLVDSSGQILHSTSRITEGHPMAEALPEFTLEQFHSAQNDLQISIRLDRTRRYLLVCQPITFAAQPGEIRSRAVGALLLKHDMGPRQAAAHQKVLAFTITVVAIGGILLLIVLFVLHRWVVHPLTRLHATIARINQGDFTLQSALPGRGELAELAAALTRTQGRLGTALAERQQAAAAALESEERFRTMFTQAPTGIALIDSLTGQIQEVNPKFAQIAGRTIEELIRIDWMQITHPDDVQEDLDNMARLNDGKITGFQMNKRYLRLDGSVVWISMTVAPLMVADRAHPHHLCMIEDISVRKQADLREATHDRTMTALAGGAPLAEVLTTLVRGVEAEHPGALGSVLLLNAAGTHLLTGAAPSLPAFYNEAIHGVAIGPAVGSCGTAVFTGERVLVADIQTDPLWTDYKVLAAQAGLAACWSEPIRGTRGRGVGSFALYHAQPCGPNEAEIGTIVAAAQLAAVAIERTQANEALRRGTQLLEASQSTAKLGGWELDLGSKQLFWTAETYRIHDTSPGEFNPTVDAGVGYFLPESRRIISEALQAAMERGEGYDLVLETLTTKGRRIDVRTTCVVTLQEGRPAKLTGIFQDITERTMAESQLRLLEASVAQLNDAVIITEADVLVAPGPRILFVNEAAERLTGFTRAELLVQTPRLFQGPKTDRAELDRIATALHHRKPVFAELINYTKAGTEYWIELNITPVQTAAGEATHFVAIERDITGRKQGEAEIRRLNDELEQRVRDRTVELQEVNQELEAFSYSVSHDLRAPLRHLTGFAELLQKNDRVKLDDQARRHLTVISESAMRMGQLIDDLLAFSRSGRTELRQAPVNLDALVQEVIQGLHSDTEGRRIVWHIAPLPDVNADANLLRMALTNLFANALKFSQPRDEATLEMGCTEHEHEHVFFIRDNGVGFDMQYVEKLFGVFQRLHGTEEFEGTGIGLANVRRIISRHGGRTWAESVLGEGATFYFSLPKPTGNKHPERKTT